MILKVFLIITYSWMFDKTFGRKVCNGRLVYNLATQLKKRTAALWARSAMKGDDCGVFI
jgi:hypothetical protein